MKRILIEDIDRALARSSWLRGHPPICPQCSADQVQLTRVDLPAAWKCRICKVRFELEPQQ